MCSNLELGIFFCFFGYFIRILRVCQVFRFYCLNYNGHMLNNVLAEGMSSDLRTELCDSGDTYINDPLVELQWAEKASRKAEIHTSLLLSSDTRKLKLCREQDVIYQRFRADFPGLDVKNVRKVVHFTLPCLDHRAGLERRVDGKVARVLRRLRERQGLQLWIFAPSECERKLFGQEHCAGTSGEFGRCAPSMPVHV